MLLHITGKNLDVTPALKKHTEEKLQRIQLRDPHITSLNIVFHIEHNAHHVEATAHLAGADINAHAHADDMYAAVDMVINKLLAQITKHKEKQADRRG